MQGRISWATLCTLFLAAVFVAAIWTTIGFPLGTLGDEWAKIDAVRTGNNRYYHPLLMIEVTQFANLFAGARDLQAIVEVGRTCAALAGGLLVFATYWLARLVLPELGALAATFATAATPIVTVHARIMKEDIFVAPFLILGLAAPIKLLQDPTPLRALLTGVYAGLAGGAKYIGTLFLPFALAAIWFMPGPRGERRLAAWSLRRRRHPHLRADRASGAPQSRAAPARYPLRISPTRRMAMTCRCRYRSPMAGCIFREVCGRASG